MIPHIQVYGPNIIEQADLLYFPSDNGYKYHPRHPNYVLICNNTRFNNYYPSKTKLVISLFCTLQSDSIGS